jgi:Protein of unknown function (DUF1097)
VGKTKQIAALAFAVAVLAALWLEVSLNYSFHWFSNGDLGNGLGLPGNFSLVAPAGFIAWALFFAAGGDRAALIKVAIGSAIGSIAGLLLMASVAKTAQLPHFWSIAVCSLVIAFFAVLLMAAGDWYYAPASLAAFGAVAFWWTATGLDGWAPGGGGHGSGLASLASPKTAGAGAFGGVLSTPYGWVWASVLASLLAGCVFGYASAMLGGLLGRAAAGRPSQ